MALLRVTAIYEIPEEIDRRGDWAAVEEYVRVHPAARIEDMVHLEE